MGELLACFQGLSSIIPEWYGSWEELSHDIINSIYVPDYIINEDTGEFAVLNSHLVLPWPMHPHTGPDDAESGDSYIRVGIGGMWRMSGSIYGRTTAGAIRFAGSKEYAYHEAATQNRFWQRHDGNAAKFRRSNIHHSKDQRFIVLRVGAPHCYRCGQFLTTLRFSELNHNGMKHREGCNEG